MSDDATAPENEAAEAPAGAAAAEPSASAQTQDDEAPVLLANADRSRAYAERLYVAWWMALLPLAGALLLAASVQRGYPQLADWVPYAVLLPLAVFVMLSLSRSRIRVVTDGDEPEPELHVDQAHLPVRFIGSVEIISSRDKRVALGPQLDPAAYLLHRSSIGPVLRLEVTDPDDDTPYWLFSTRKPERLARALGTQPSTRGGK